MLIPPNTSPTGTPTDQPTLDATIERATGVFWRNDASGLTNTTQDFIQRADGTSHTFLFSENLDAGFCGPDPRHDQHATRRDLQTGYIAFGISVTVADGDDSAA